MAERGGLELAKAYIQVIPTTKDFKEHLTREIGGQGEEAGKKLGDGVASGFKNAVGAIAKVTAEAIAGGMAAVGVMAKQSVAEFANYEQLTGGIETLFKDSSGIIMDYASNAYKTAQMSANDYMEMATSFSASLLQGLDGDTKAAAEMSNTAIIDMADNANKMGSSMESIQDAYQGFAKQNYTMLDNLKLGYGGTASEMLRLVKDAGVVNDSVTSINDVSFDQIIEAIHIIQEDMGIAGTSSQEASATISGSINMAKSAWNNLLMGMADPNQDILPLISDMFESIIAIVTNIEPIIETLIPKLSEGLTALITALVSYLPGMLELLLPALVEGSITLVNGIVALLPTILESLIAALPTIVNALMVIVPQVIFAITESIPLLIEALMLGIQQLLANIAESLPLFVDSIMEIITQIINAILEAIPQLIEAGMELLTAIVGDLPGIIKTIIGALPEIIESIIETLLDSVPYLIETGITLLVALVDALPQIIETIVNVLPQIIDSVITTLLDHLPEIIDAGIGLLTALITDMPTIVLTIIGAIPDIINGIINTLTEHIDEIIQMGFDLLIKLGEGLIKAIPDLLGNIPQIITAILDAFGSLLEGILDVGANMVSGLWEGISSGAGWLWDQVCGWLDGLWNDILGFFGIHSPSTEMAWIGEMLDAGMAKGITDNAGDITDALDDVTDITLGSLDTDLGVNASLGVSSDAEATNQLGILCQLVDQLTQKVDNMQVVLDGDMLVGGISSRIDNALGQSAISTRRGVAIT